MIEAAGNGAALQAVKEIKFGLNIGLKEAKELWDTSIRKSTSIHLQTIIECVGFLFLQTVFSFQI